VIAAASDGAALAGVAGVLVVYLLVMIGLTIACGYWAKSIMVGKGRSGSSGFCLGFFLGLLGVLIAALLSPTPEHELRKQQQMMAMMGSAQGFYMGQSHPPSQAGQWAADPFGRHQLRYHDGLRWTDNVSNNGAMSTDPAQARVAVAATGQWSPDPYRRHELRYFDGTNWTMSVSNNGTVSTDPLG